MCDLLYIGYIYIKAQLVLLSEKIIYNVLEGEAEKIRDLVAKDRFRNPTDFIDTALRILLTWESKRPEECNEIMLRLLPFTPEQDAYMKMMMKEKERIKHFGISETDRAYDEAQQQKSKAEKNDDHIKLRENLPNAMVYIENLKIKTPQNIIQYDEYPLLFSFYSRFLPVKIVINVLGDLLQQKNDWKIELKELRVEAYDIAEEISEKLVAYEKENDIPRNRKVSTGLPKKGQDDKDVEKIAMAQKRFKDQFIGKIRRSRVTKQDHFEGAPTALGLIYAFEDDETEYVALTSKGKEFFLLENPVIKGEFGKSPLSNEESDFILKELIPQLGLEQKFVDTAIKTIESYSPNTGQKLTDTLDIEFHKTAKDYKTKNPSVAKNYNLNHLDSMKDSATERKIVAWRVATMGRLAELHVVKWKIDESGDSEFSLLKPLAPKVKA